MRHASNGSPVMVCHIASVFKFRLRIRIVGLAFCSLLKVHCHAQSKVVILNFFSNLQECFQDEILAIMHHLVVQMCQVTMKLHLWQCMLDGFHL